MVSGDSGNERCLFFYVTNGDFGALRFEHFGQTL